MLPISDIIVVVASLVPVYIAARKGKSADSSGFIIAGRTLTLPFFVATLVATWYGAVLGSGEFIMRYGIAFILCFGLPYYAVALAYAVFLSKRVHESRTVSIPDQFGQAYGPRGRIIVAIMLLVISTPASYQLMMGILLGELFSLPLMLGIVLGTGLSIAYVVGGGLRSDVRANVVQVILMYSGMAILIAFAILTYGSPIRMWESLPTGATSIPGPIGWTGIMGWFVIALQTFIDPNFYVRTVAATHSQIARKGLVLSVACWMIFDVMQLLAGLYIVAHAPATEPTTSYLEFANAILPSIYRGVFAASLLAAVMSTLDGYALSSATMLVHDILTPVSDSRQQLRRYRWGLGIIAILGGITASLVPSIIDIIFYSASIAISSVLVPLILSFSAKAYALRRSIAIQLVFPAVMATLSLVTNFGEPIFVGLATSIVLAGFSLIRARYATT